MCVFGKFYMTCSKVQARLMLFVLGLAVIIINECVMLETLIDLSF